MLIHHYAHLSLYLRNMSLMSEAAVSDSLLRRPTFEVELTNGKDPAKGKAHSVL